MRPIPVLLLGLLLSVPLAASGARIYYTDQPNGSPGSVRSVGLDGSNAGTVITYPGSPSLRGIGWHRELGRVFVLDNAAKQIRSILPDGTGEVNVAAVSAGLLGSDLEVDDETGRIFWAETSLTAGINGLIRSCNADGTDVATVVSTTGGTATSPYFIFLDRPGGFIYWGVQENATSQNGPTTFRRGSFAGAIDAGFGITTQTRSRDIAVDPTTGIAYFADRQTGAIFRRRPLEATNEFVISGMNAPHGVGIDVLARKVYWADTGQRGSGSGASSRRVARCNFDGTEFETLTASTGANEPWDLTLDLSSPTYAAWSSRFFSIGAAQRAALADADGDGAANLMEYAFDSRPRDPGEIKGVRATSEGITFPRRRTSPLTYRVEISTDATTWHYNGDGSGQIWTEESGVTPLDAEMDTVSVRATGSIAGERRLYFRLRISTSEP